MTKKRFYLMNVEDPFHEYGRWCKPVLEDGETEKQYENALELMDLLNELHEENENLKDVNVQCCNDYSAMRRDVLHYKKENEQLKSTIAQLIEQNRKNNDLLLSDIRILEKALWCSGCENDYGRLKELRKEFIR